MVINGHCLLEAAPIKDMARQKINEHGVSYGLGEAGYDIRLKQDIRFVPPPGYESRGTISVLEPNESKPKKVFGRFLLASAMEEFQMPPDLMGIVHDKSTWARKGLSVFNTVIEPGWQGFLTLELVFQGWEDVHIPAGAGIAQVIFHRVIEPRAYNGKYQNQEDKPVEARMSHQGPVPIISATGLHPSNLDEACRVERQYYNQDQRGWEPK